MEQVEVKKMIKELNAGDYAKAKVTLKGIVEAKIEERIKVAMDED